MNMRTALNIVAIILAIAGTSACVKNPMDPTPHSPNVSQPKQNPDAIKMTEGGQPGDIQISGAIVEDRESKPQLDERVSIVARGGIGISGAEAPIDSSYQPQLSTRLDAKSQFKLPSDHSIISVGCDPETMGRHSQSLTVKQPIKNKDDITVHIDASTVLLCGKIDFEYQFVAVNADRLILIDMDYSQSGILNVTRFSTNHLVMIGVNKITSKAADLDDTRFPGPILALEVAQEFQPEPGSKMEIVSVGSRYVARK